MMETTSTGFGEGQPDTVGSETRLAAAVTSSKGP